MQLPLFALPSLLLAATSLLAAADAYERNDEDLLKRLAAPPWSPKLSKRTDGPGSRTAAQLRKRQQFGCSNGYEQCPGLRYCCQAGLTCFSDGTCGTVDQLTCMAGETVCGSGTKAGCCPIKSRCANNSTCVVESGHVRRRFEAGKGAAGLGAAMGVGVGVLATLGFV